MDFIRSPRRGLLTAAIFLFSCLEFTSCATQVHVRSSATPGVDLTHFTTYALASHPVDPSDPTKSEIDRVLESQVIAQLADHGLQAVAREPQLRFRYETQRITGYAGENRWKYQEGALELSAVDTQGNVVWQTHADTVIDPSKKDYQQLKTAIRKAFKNYPKVVSH